MVIKFPYTYVVRRQSVAATALSEFRRLHQSVFKKEPHDKPTDKPASLWDVCESGWGGVAVRWEPASVGLIEAIIQRFSVAPHFAKKFLSVCFVFSFHECYAILPDQIE